METQIPSLRRNSSIRIKIYVEGTLSIQKYTTNEGQSRTNTKVIIQNVIFLDNKPK
ncbi:single-stranded DNA-binding protein [Candidatus Phytoplasma solani]|uniref:single-stranded DNA-binding protein n=1 Tax=Candidatus Phytoplasma solani TaxID=69896 RepID=UPI00358E7743